MPANYRPFRVSYYKICQLEKHGVNQRAPLHSILQFASSPEQAKALVATLHDRVPINAYLFYRELKQPKRKTWYVVSGPESVATKAVLQDLTGMAKHDSHEQLMDTFSSKTAEPRLELYGVSEVQRVYTEISSRQSAKSAIAPSGSAVPTPEDSLTCRWHGTDYMVNGHCTKLDPTPIRNYGFKTEIDDKWAILTLPNLATAPTQQGDAPPPPICDSTCPLCFPKEEPKTEPSSFSELPELSWLAEDWRQTKVILYYVAGLVLAGAIITRFLHFW